eukprot:10926862-Alexandrium_andersonii.AAC.1
MDLVPACERSAGALRGRLEAADAGADVRYLAVQVLWARWSAGAISGSPMSPGTVSASARRWARESHWHT